MPYTPIHVKLQATRGPARSLTRRLTEKPARFPDSHPSGQTDSSAMVQTPGHPPRQRARSPNNPGEGHHPSGTPFPSRGRRNPCTRGSPFWAGGRTGHRDWSGWRCRIDTIKPGEHAPAPKTTDRLVDNPVRVTLERRATRQGRWSTVGEHHDWRRKYTRTVALRRARAGAPGIRDRRIPAIHAWRCSSGNPASTRVTGQRCQ